MLQTNETASPAGGAPVERVRSHTASEVNSRIDRLTAASLRAAAANGGDTIAGRISRLRGEWDVERWLETNAGAISLAGLLLGTLVNRKWLALPAVVFPFLMQHSVQGWCPPLPVFRRMGVRTQGEIEREKYALKALRGDFDSVEEQGDAETRVAEALNSSRT